VKAIWADAEQQLKVNPGLEAQELFEELLRQRPGAAAPRALRTFRRRVAQWRRKHGPDIEVFFPQVREPGKSMQLDWTEANQLGVTIAGRPYPHKLCHSILPYSNAEWAVPCQSESTCSLIAGSQDAYQEFGGVTEEFQTDQSSTATHQLCQERKERVYNDRYLALCDHLQVRARTTAVDCPDQNGDIESMNGHLKRRLEQKLLLRGSRDFKSEEAYAAFVAALCRELNRRRGGKVVEESKCLRPLPAGRFPETEEVTARVSCFATVRVKKLPFSVPARLIGALVQALVNEKTVRILYEGKEVARHPRTPGKGRVHYRHVIKWLVRKPGAFAAYQFREDLFPRPVFRQAHERLQATDEGRADRPLPAGARTGPRPGRRHRGRRPGPTAARGAPAHARRGQTSPRPADAIRGHDHALRPEHGQLRRAAHGGGLMSHDPLPILLRSLRLPAMAEEYGISPPISLDTGQ